MLKILVSGSSGLVGEKLCSFLRKKGHDVTCFIRGSSLIPEGLDAIIHLAGESLAKGFWTSAKKKRILESREKGTETLVSLIQKLKSPPKVFLAASAVGYYGTSFSPVTEESPPGSGFLSEVCIAWEAASKPLNQIGVRTVQARLGIVLSSQGGMLKSLLPLFRLGLGGKMGSGKQMISWISLEDLVRSFYHILLKNEIQGPVNVVSPFPVSQEFFAKTLAHILSKPCFFTLPRFLFRGEKAKELIFSSIEARPVKLEQSGFCFLYPKLKEALKASLF